MRETTTLTVCLVNLLDNPDEPLAFGIVGGAVTYP